MSEPDDELIERDHDGVRWISINRPRTRNALTFDLNARLLAAFRSCAATPTVRAVVLTGEGGSFSSGLDLQAAFAAGPIDVEAHLERYFHDLIRGIRAFARPVIALVDGPAVGFGCDLALACDIRLGTLRTRMGESFVRRGLMPDGGGTFHLPRLIGLGNAMHLLLSGEMVDAGEALRLGLVTRLLPETGTAAEALAFAQRIAAGPPRAHALIKRAVYGALDGTLDDALAVERRGQLELFGSRDFGEGVAAFLERREPTFTGE